MLLLAAAARPGLIKVASVDHRLRPESGAETQRVAQVCDDLHVPHRTLRVGWDAVPNTAIQEKARAARYELLGTWAEGEGLAAVATAHHLDDQAETFFMRLARGAGVKGLAAMRPSARVPGCPQVQLVRPLLRWRRAELERICADANVQPQHDPSNDDQRFERVRVREWLRNSAFFEPEAVARSSEAMSQADDALEWATDASWEQRTIVGEGRIVLRSSGLPAEILRRLVNRAIRLLATEGNSADLRGREVDQLLGSLQAGARTTLRGVVCSGGREWTFVTAPARSGRSGGSR
jgi:tRNA(Ile)-lysidine synthase